MIIAFANRPLYSVPPATEYFIVADVVPSSNAAYMLVQPRTKLASDGTTVLIVGTGKNLSIDPPGTKYLFNSSDNDGVYEQLLFTPTEFVGQVQSGNGLVCRVPYVVVG